MATPTTQEPGVGTGSAPIESTDVEQVLLWARQNQLPFDPNVFFALSKTFQVVSVGVNATYTAPIVDSNYHVTTNSVLWCRPNVEAHLFVLSHWEFDVQTGGTAPTASLQINLQLWLNGYHVYISPSGVANDYTVFIPAIAANQHWRFAQTWWAGIFNVEFRQQGVVTPVNPDFHVIDFRYNVPSIPSGWTTVQFMPRLSVVFSIPTTAINFVNVPQTPDVT